MTTPRLRRAGHLVEQIVREPRRGAPHHHPVHAVRTRTERATQPRRAELQARAEAIGKVIGVARSDQRRELGPCVGIGILLEPAGRGLDEVCGHERSVEKDIAGRGPKWLITSAAARDASFPHASRGMS